MLIGVRSPPLLPGSAYRTAAFARFIDTNVVIYAYDSSDARKQSIAQELLAEGMTADDAVISTQVLGEFFILTVNRKRLLTAEEAIRALGRLKVQPVDAPMVRAAVENQRNNVVTVASREAP